MPTFKDPTAPTEDKETKLYDELEKKTYFCDCSAVKAQKAQWEENNQKVYNLFLSHCTPNMETKLQGMETWPIVEDEQDGLKLTIIICNIVHRRDETSKAILDIVRADKELMLCHQKEHQSLTQYVAESKARIAVIEGAGGYPGQHAAAEKLVAEEQGLVLASAAPYKWRELQRL